MLSSIEYGCGAKERRVGIWDLNSKWRIRELDRGLLSILKLIEMPQQHSDSSRPLHVTSLRDKQLGSNPMLRLNPTHSVSIARGFGKQLASHALREIDIIAPTRRSIQIQKELRDAGRAATLADIVPESRRLLFRDATGHNSSCSALDPGHPIPITSNSIKPVKQSRSPDRAVTPSEIKEIFPVRFVMKNQANIAVSLRNVLKILRAGERGIEEFARLRLLIQSRKEVSDAGSAV